MTTEEFFDEWSKTRPQARGLKTKLTNPLVLEFAEYYHRQKLGQGDTSGISALRTAEEGLAKTQ
jgi:hypothetical protein